MPVRVGINGFGRIGRLVCRAAARDKNLQIVGVNDLVPPDNLAYLFRHDTVHGRYDGKVEATESMLKIDGREIRCTAEKDPAVLPWKDLKVDYVIESTGHFTDRAGASKPVDPRSKGGFDG